MPHAQLRLVEPMSPSDPGAMSTTLAQPLRNSELVTIGVALGGALVVVLLPIDGALAFGIGVAVALTFGANASAARIADPALKASLVGLGFGVELEVAARAGAHGFLATAVTLLCVVAGGVALGRWLRVGRRLSLLIAAGTAICGGSAIAAIAPVLRARASDVTIALSVVLLLNGIALLLFPALGSALDDGAFGTWCAIAIHDTSSVVVAASTRGEHALEIATATKLARALWIVPLGMVLARSARATVRVPYFLIGFVVAAAVAAWIDVAAPSLGGACDSLAAGARRLLAAAVWLVGLSVSRRALRRAGPRPLVLGATLWAVLAAVTLAWLST